MVVPWKKYEQDAAAFFTSLGLKAEIETTIQGARTKHAIDVLVTGTYQTLPLKWIVECKCWKTNVPKEKVLALQATTQDVGADKGILLSETGFQSGAIRACKNTNITLTSLEDLRLDAKQALDEEVLKDILWRLTRARKELRKINKFQEDVDFRYYTPAFIHMGTLMSVEAAISDALSGELPTVYHVDGEKRLWAANFGELITGCYPLLNRAEVYLKNAPPRK
jgi:hypothetical protein